MTYEPTFKDAASDLNRCIYASLSPLKFSDPVFIEFFNQITIILKNKEINCEVLKRINKSQDKNMDHDKRREDLLMASIFLQNL